jgi:pSer/pThr/pTyr-binding forkhead associated (FHA) protein
LESLNQEKNTSRIVHIVKPSAGKDVFKMGRGHESDLRINDISVSRLHAMIKYKDGKFLLEDNVSKFGTLVLINKRTPLFPNYNKAVQIGRTVINFAVKAMNKIPLMAPRQLMHQESNISILNRDNNNCEGSCSEDNIEEKLNNTPA